MQGSTVKEGQRQLSVLLTHASCWFKDIAVFKAKVWSWEGGYVSMRFSSMKDSFHCLFLLTL